MAHLDTLNIVVKPNLRPVTAEDHKRHKLIIKLQEQLCMAEAELQGTSYRRMKWVTQPDEQGMPQRRQRVRLGLDPERPVGLVLFGEALRM